MRPSTHSTRHLWPAGSVVDYLFAAGLWVGGIKNGVPLVSTGQFENELQATSQQNLDDLEGAIENRLKVLEAK